MGFPGNVIGGGLGGIAAGVGQAVGGAIGGAAKAVGSAASTAAYHATHPKTLVQDLTAVVKAAPGIALNTALLPVHSVALAAGGATYLVGEAVHSNALKAAGSGVVGGDILGAKAAVKNPIASSEVLAGTALTVTGIASGPGVALAGAGLGGILKQVAAEVAGPKTTSTAKPPADVVPPSTSASSQAPKSLVRPSLLRRVEAWLSFRFGKGTGIP